MTAKHPWTRLTVRDRVLVAATITILLSGIAGYQVYRETQRSAVLVASYTSTLTAATTGRTLTFVAQNVNRLLVEALHTQDTPALAADPMACRARLEELARLGPLSGLVSNLYVIHGSTVTCQMLPGTISTKTDDGSLFRELQPTTNTSEMRSSAPFVGSLSKRWIISVALPRTSADGMTAGAAIDLEKLNEYALGSFPEELLITVTDTDAVTLLRSRDFDSRVGKTVPFLPEVTDVRQQVRGQPFDVGPNGLPRVLQENAVVSPDRDGSLRVWSSQAVETVPWVLYAGTSTAIVNTPWTVVGLGPGTSITLLVVILLLLATVSRSLTRLVSGVEQSAAAGPSAIPVDGPPDVAIVGQALKSTLAARLASEAALEEANRGLEEKVAERSRELADKAADLEEVVKKLIEADRVKDVFLGTMSHELRTPITSILGLIETLLAGTLGPLNDDQRRALEVCVQCAKDQTVLIKEVLDYTKLHSGSMPYDLSPAALQDIVESATVAIAGQAAAKRLRLTCSIADGERRVMVDARRIRQVLLNVFSNAVKFSPEGATIAVAASVMDGNAIIRITDSGPGIAPDQQERIFEPFIQIDSGLRRSFEGLGLGLAICRSIVAHHGGTIRVESELGHGSTFVIALPQDGPATHAPA